MVTSNTLSKSNKSIKMKNLLFFTILLGTITTLEAKYCIQVLSVDSKLSNVAIKEAQKDLYKNYNDVRVEERSPYSVLRVGNYNRYKDAVKKIVHIRKIHNDAYIRECKLDYDKIIYSLNLQPKRDENLTAEPADENLTLEPSDENLTLEPTDENLTLEPTDENLTLEPTDENLTLEPTDENLTPFEALSKAFEVSNEGDQTKAYKLFSKATHETNTASVYNNACTGVIINAPLRRKNISDPYFATFYGTALWFKRAYKPETLTQHNFNDTVYQFKIRAGRYMDQKKKTSIYLFAHLDGDTKSKAGVIPVIYSDNYTGVGIGADYKFTQYTRLFVEYSFEDNRIQHSGDDSTQFDYRAGFTYYDRWGPAKPLNCSYNLTTPIRWFSDLYVSTVFYSRYNNNIILQSSARLGLELLSYKMSSVFAYEYFGITADSKGDFYNNIIETGPGIEIKPYQPFPFSIRTEYRLSKYFRNLPSNESDRFDTLLIYGIFYFEQ